MSTTQPPVLRIFTATPVALALHRRRRMVCGYDRRRTLSCIRHTGAFDFHLAAQIQTQILSQPVPAGCAQGDSASFLSRLLPFLFPGYPVDDKPPQQRAQRLLLQSSKCNNGNR